MPTVVCSFCEKEFERPQYLIKEKNFCSRPCSAQSRKSSYDETLEMHQFYSEGNSLIVTGRHFGLTDMALISRFKKHGFMTRQKEIDPSLRNYTEADLKFQYLECKKTISELQELYGVSRSLIQDDLKRFNITTRKASKRDQKGKNNDSWKGGFSYTNQGYKLVLMPEHPNAQTNGYVFEHVLIALKKFGFDKLPTDSCVHHINLNIKDNSEANLDVCKISKHMEYHSQLQYHAASFLIGNGLIKFNSRDGYYYNNSDLLPKLIPQKIPRVKKYKSIKKENHPNARKGWIAEHVYIALKTANQDRLRKGQAVHHIDPQK